jgi:hypothetical protein
MKNSKIWPVALTIGLISLVLWSMFDPGGPGLDFGESFLWLALAAFGIAAFDLLRFIIPNGVKNSVREAIRPKVTSNAGMSTADELEKWARLRDTGVVTEAQFQAARAELLKERHT